MTSIQLKRSGGMLGKSLQASDNFDVEEESVMKQVLEMAVVKEPGLRDAFYYSISINGGNFVPVDITLLKGPLKKIVNALEDGLNAG